MGKGSEMGNQEGKWEQGMGRGSEEGDKGWEDKENVRQQKNQEGHTQNL